MHPDRVPSQPAKNHRCETIRQQASGRPGRSLVRWCCAPQLAARQQEADASSQTCSTWGAKAAQLLNEFETAVTHEQDRPVQ